MKWSDQLYRVLFILVLKYLILSLAILIRLLGTTFLLLRLILCNCRNELVSVWICFLVCSVGCVVIHYINEPWPLHSFPCMVFLFQWIWLLCYFVFVLLLSLLQCSLCMDSLQSYHEINTTLCYIHHHCECTVLHLYYHLDKKIFHFKAAVFICEGKLITESYFVSLPCRSRCTCSVSGC